MDETRVRLLLKNLGLSEWESNSYWVLVKYGPQTAIGLSRLSKVARSKTYEVMTRLRRKGLVMKLPAMATAGVTQKFVAIDPGKVFGSKIEDMKELAESLEEIYKNPKEPVFPEINMYTSKEAVKELLFDVVQNSKFFYIYLSDLKIRERIGYSFDNIMRAIKKKKYHFLLKDNEELREFSKDLKKFSFLKDGGEMGYIIASDRVILDLYKQQHVMLEIVSEDAVKTFLNLYEAKIKK